MKPTYNLFVSVCLLFVCVYSYPGQLTVTPPGAFQSGSSSSNVQLAEGTCYDRSNVTSGGYHKYCKKYRECLPLVPNGDDDQLNEQLVYFKSSYVDKFASSALGVESITSFEGVDTYIDGAYKAYIETKLQNGGKVASECLEIGIFFWCSMLYPFCFDLPGMAPLAVSPCRDVCVRAKSTCEEDLHDLIKILDIDCDTFPDGPACIPDVHCSTTTTTTTTAPPTPTTTTETTSTTSTTTTSTVSSTTATTTTTTPTPTTTTTAPITTIATPTDPSAHCMTEFAPACEKKCKSIRSRYSSNVIRNGKYGFLAYVKVLGTFVDENCHNVYKVRIINNFDIKCDITGDYACGEVVNVYMTNDNSTSSSCDQCITESLNYDPMDTATNANTYVIAGTVNNGKWILDGTRIRCIVSTILKVNKIKVWLSGDCPIKESTREICTT